jgi:hypothetical protein
LQLIERYRNEPEATVKKKLQKSLKKGLTKTRKCGIINKSLDEVRTSKNDKNCILKTEQCEKKKRQEKLEPLLILKNQFEKSDKTIKRKQ